MNPSLPENLETVLRSQVEAWTAELEVLRRDARVRKFAELRRRIDEADAFVMEADGPSMSNRSPLFYPYEAYDAFEFARDLAGREVSTDELSKLASGRFPEVSKATRRLVLRYLVENGVAEIVRRTASGRATSYRFASLGNGGFGARRKRMGLPENELSGFKADDLREVPMRARPNGGRGRHPLRPETG
ncbi:MAG TPA: hypothetical protein VF992_07785 [Thermoplasmata archaeon]